MTSIIVACDENGVIGKKDQIPWRVSADLKLFRQRTMGHAIIMGRKTWDGLPKKPLDGRANVVISRTKYEYQSDPLGPFWYGSLQGAIDDITNCKKYNYGSYKDKDIFIIGGAEIYKVALENKLVDKIYMSEIDGRYVGDVYFPVLDKSDWIETATEHCNGFKLHILRNRTRMVYDCTDI